MIVVLPNTSNRRLPMAREEKGVAMNSKDETNSGPPSFDTTAGMPTPWLMFQSFYPMKAMELLILLAVLSRAS